MKRDLYPLLLVDELKRRLQFRVVPVHILGVLRIDLTTKCVDITPRSGKFKCESAHNKRRKDSNGRSSFHKTCFATL